MEGDFPMKRLLIVASVALLPLAVGCSSNKKPKGSTATITDTAPPPAPIHSTPIAAQPVDVTPVTYPVSSTPVAVEPAPTGGGKYTVRKGDTLWSIASKTYGDGKQYKRIIAANPNIKGERVMVGQTITLP